MTKRQSHIIQVALLHLQAYLDTHNGAAEITWAGWGKEDGKQPTDEELELVANIVSDKADVVKRDMSKPDDIREAGWVVAAHNDYTQRGKPHTFWLFTRNGQCVKGEGKTDKIALNQIRRELELEIWE